ncbi:Coenzyme F420 hydrogenase/dehydrogenase, beta subunit C-terminal domain [Thermodesulfobacteriota bacterium]
MKEESFQELKRQAVDTQLCIFCGTCVAVCPAGCIAFQADGPQLDGECTECGQCLEACPGLGGPLQQLDQLVFGRVRTEEEDMGGLGIRLADTNLISGDREIRRHGYTGGKLTAVLASLLEKKEIQGAVVSRWGEVSPFPWFAWPVVATTREGLVDGAGSKYVFTPNLMALEEIAARQDIDSIALVGLPCHLQGLRKLELLGEPYSTLAGKVKYAFGLYCGAPMLARDDFMRYVAELCETSSEKIAAVDFHRVSKEFDVAYDLVLKDGEHASKRFNIGELLTGIGRYPRWYRCTLCTDYSAEHADISFGGSHVTPRTKAGNEVVTRALADGWLVPSRPIEHLDKLAEQVDRAMTKMKKEENRRRISEFKNDGKPVPNYD